MDLHLDSAPATGVRLRPDANWPAAAGALAGGLARLTDDEARVRLLERVCIDLGDALYPAFIKLLCAVEHFGDAAACARVADTLAYGLSTGRLPSGAVRAWGGGGSLGGLPSRNLGPLEFLCVWYRQAGAQSLAPTAFGATLERLLALVSHSPQAVRLYCTKLRADAAETIEGAYSRSTRTLLAQLAGTWSSGAVPGEIVAQLLAADVAAEAPFGAPIWSGR